MNLMQLAGLGLGVVLCAATAAGQNSKSQSETKPSTQSTPESTATHVANDEAMDAYREGRADYKRGDMANAAVAYQSAVKNDPQFGMAWRELGRTRMSLRQPVEAEAAFRNYLELSPGDAYALSLLAWALIAEKKYSEGIEVLRKQLAIEPDAGNVYQRIGDAYMRMKLPERAIPEFKKAVLLLPDAWGPLYQLGEAYMQTHDYDQAAASFERSFAIEGVIGRMNDAAFGLAEAKSHLDLAEKWAAHIVQVVELELNQVKMPVDSLSLQRANALAAFWDTLGWVKFRKGELPAAEKYVFAALDIVADSGGWKHLGEIYEAEGRASDAVRAYAGALALAPGTRELNEDEKAARERLAALLGGDSLIEQRVKQERAKMEARRTVRIPNTARVAGLTEYAVIIGSDSKVVDVATISPDDPLSELKDAVRSAKVPQSFPDETTKKLPRRATLSCPRKKSPCQLTLMPTAAGVTALMPIAPPPASR